MKINRSIKYMILGQIGIYCEEVNKGTKLCAQMTILNDFLPILIVSIKQEKCKAIILDEGAEYKNIFIYKYDFVEKLIKGVIERSKKPHPDVFEVWATGKLFGYSDYEISKYLKKHGYLRKGN